MFKPTKMESKITVVSIYDPSIDWDEIAKAELDAHPEIRDGELPAEEKNKQALDLFSQRYARISAKDPSAWKDHLKFKSGEAPTKFTIGVITVDEMARIADECRYGQVTEMRKQLRWRAFMACVRGIENYSNEKCPTIRVGQVDYLDPDWLKKNFVRGMMLVALDIGMTGWLWNSLTEDEVKN